MSGNLTAVREISGILLKVREMSGKYQRKNLSGEHGLKLFIVSCIFVSMLDFAELVHFYIGFGSNTVAFLPPTTDNNTSTGMI